MDDTDPRREVWDSYWKTENPEYASHNILVDHVLKHIYSKSAAILEIGAGSGADAVEIAAAGYTVVAMDISKESLKLVKLRAKEKQIELIPLIGDALNLPFKENSLDFIYHQGVLEHFKDPLPFLSQQKRALKKGGRLLVDVPQAFTIYTLKKRWAMARNKWFAGWETEYSPRKLRRTLVKASLTIISFYGRDYDFIPFIWLSNIENLGKSRFGRPVVPQFISRPIAKIWRIFEGFELSNNIKHCIGAVAAPSEDRN